jgi:predicted dehydrogenase
LGSGKVSRDRLKAAVLGLDDGGRLLLEAASGAEHLDVQAVADRDPDVAERVGEQHKCVAYDDYRQLVMQNQFDCLLVAAGLHACEEHLRAAIKKKFNILKLAPPARNFEEAVEFARLADENKVKFAVANDHRFADGFIALRRFLQQGAIEHVFLVTLDCGLPGGRPPAWQTDPIRAGGGVLLYHCYGLIDQLVWNFTIPEMVYSLSVSSAGDRAQRQYRTEDAAVVAMRFGDSLVANLTATPFAGRGIQQDQISVFAKDKSLTAAANLLTVRDHQQMSCEEFKHEHDALCCTRRALESFALSILEPDKNPLCSGIRENLRNLAVIEAAYLSARTGMPEEPARVLRMVCREPTFIWPVHMD